MSDVSKTNELIKEANTVSTNDVVANPRRYRGMIRELADALEVSEKRRAAVLRMYDEVVDARQVDEAAAALVAATRVPVPGELNDDREALLQLAFDHDPDDCHPTDQKSCKCGAVIGVSDGVVVTTDGWGHLVEMMLAAGFSRATVPDAATEIARSLAMASAITGADAEVIAGASVKLAALGEIAELHALCDDRLWSVEKHAERMEAERDAALAAVERVRAIHKRVAFDDAPDELHCKRCQITAGTWPCPTIAALDGAPEPEWEREYRRVRPDGVPVFNAVFETMPLLDDYYTAEYRTVSPWLPVEGESNANH